MGGGKGDSPARIGTEGMRLVVGARTGAHFQCLRQLFAVGSWGAAGDALPQAEEGWAFTPRGMVGCAYLEAQGAGYGKCGRR